MKRPWMKFYPADWRADAALRMCSMAARGLWMEMLSIMHNAEPYGHLTINGVALDQKQLSQLAGCGLRECINLLSELEVCGVFSRTNDGVIYSRKMKRQREKELRDQENGKRGGNPDIKGRVNPEDKAQKLDARSQKLEKKKKALAEREREFNQIWEIAPKRNNPNPRLPALKAYCKAIKSGCDPGFILSAVKQWANEDRDKDRDFIPAVRTWLSERRFESYERPDPAREAVINLDMAKRGYEWRDGKWSKIAEEMRASDDRPSAG